MINLTFHLSEGPNITNLLERTPSNFCRNRSGVRKIVDFRHFNSRMSETMQGMAQVAIDY